MAIRKSHFSLQKYLNTCLRHQSVAPFLSGATLLRTILDTPLIVITECRGFLNLLCKWIDHHLADMNMWTVVTSDYDLSLCHSILFKQCPQLGSLREKES